MTSLYPTPWLNQKQNKTETKAKQKSKGWSINTQTGRIPIPFPMGSGFPGGSDGKESASVQETQVQSLGQEAPLEEEMATHSTTLAWRIPRTEEPSGLHSMGSQKSDKTEQLTLSLFTCIINTIYIGLLLYS